MNTDINRACNLTVSVRTALKAAVPLKYVPEKHDTETVFLMLPRKRGFTVKSMETDNSARWFKYCYNKAHMCNFKLLMPDIVPEKPAFSGIIPKMVCFFEDKTATELETRLSPHEKGGVLVRFEEKECADVQPAKARYSDNSEQLFDAITKMSAFADEMGFNNDSPENMRTDTDEEITPEKEAQPEYAEGSGIFRDLITAAGLLDNQPLPDEMRFKNLPKLSEKRLKIYAAAMLADIFTNGDNALSKAALYNNKGDKYYSLAGKLWENIRLSLLYAVNES